MNEEYQSEETVHGGECFHDGERMDELENVEIIYIRLSCIDEADRCSRFLFRVLAG